MTRPAEVLTAPDQIRGESTVVQEIRNDTAVHLALDIQTAEQLNSNRLAKDKWMLENGNHEWFRMENYRGLLWNNTERTDNWPDYEYHEYHTVQSAMNSEESTSEWALTKASLS